MMSWLWGTTEIKHLPKDEDPVTHPTPDLEYVQVDKVYTGTTEMMNVTEFEGKPPSPEPPSPEPPSECYLIHVDSRPYAVCTTPARLEAMVTQLTQSFLEDPQIYLITNGQNHSFYRSESFCHKLVHRISVFQLPLST